MNDRPAAALLLLLSATACRPSMDEAAVREVATKTATEVATEHATKVATEQATQVAKAAVGAPAAQSAEDGTVCSQPAKRGCAPWAGSWYLHVSDIHFIDEDGSKLGISETAWTNAQAKLTALVQQHPPQFILMTGDLPGYQLQPTDREARIKKVLAGLEAVSNAAPTPIPLLVLPGNNDTLNVDYGHYTAWTSSCAAAGTPLSDAGWTEPVKHVTDWGWSNEALGSFTATPVKGLTVVAMNSVVFSGKYPCGYGTNECDCMNDTKEDADDELSALENALKAAQARGDKVLIAMHIPPGEDYGGADQWADPQHVQTFLSHVATYESTVVGVAFGHSHMDELRRICAASGEPTALRAIGLSSPALLQNHGNASGFKGVALDPSTFELVDAITWYNTSKSAPFGQDDCYSVAEVLGCTDAEGVPTSPSLQQCVQQHERRALVYELSQIYDVCRSGDGSVGTCHSIDVGQCP